MSGKLDEAREHCHDFKIVYCGPMDQPEPDYVACTRCGYIPTSDELLSTTYVKVALDKLQDAETYESF